MHGESHDWWGLDRHMMEVAASSLSERTMVCPVYRVWRGKESSRLVRCRKLVCRGTRMYMDEQGWGSPDFMQRVLTLGINVSPLSLPHSCY